MADRNPRILAYGDAAVAEAAAAIRAGGIVAVPTETVYGLAADATNAEAVASIYAAKGRPNFNPLIVHVLDLATAEALAVFDDDASDLAARFWPGPLTLVLPVRREAGLAAAVTAGLDTVAIRVPAHRAMRAVLAACGKPLAAPSANVSNGLSPTTAAHVAASLGERVPLILDDGPCPAGVESTIVMGREVLRPGPIAVDDLFPGEGRGPVAVLSRLSSRAAAGAVPTGPRPSPGNNKVVAPGQLESHYAPRKALRVNVTSVDDNEWLIGFGPIPGNETLSPTGDLTEAAANLFAALHRADASSRASIAVAPIPDTGIGAAINDRLRRAAHR